MRDVRVRDRKWLEEPAGDVVRPVLREWLAVPADGERPVLAVERTVAPAGPTRGPVVLVHGLAQNRFTWRLSGRSLCAWLAHRGFDVLNLELRGHGLSREWGAPSAARFDDYVDDLARVVARCAAPPFVIGHSLGGAVGIAVAVDRPLRGLVHLAGVYGFAGANPVLRALARLTLAWEGPLRAAPLRVRTRAAGRVIARLYQLTDVAGYGAPIAGWAPDSIERELLEERLVKGFDWTSVEVWLQMSRWACGEAPAFDVPFRDLDLPLLVVAGDADPLVRPADAERTYAASGSTDKELLVFNDFDHQVHWGHIDLILGRLAPREVWPRLAAWLEAR